MYLKKLVFTAWSLIIGFATYEFLTTGTTDTFFIIFLLMMPVILIFAIIGPLILVLKKNEGTMPEKKQETNNLVGYILLALTVLLVLK